jgi:hypothetical protein
MLSELSTMTTLPYLCFSLLLNGFWIWWSNLLNLCTTCYNSSLSSSSDWTLHWNYSDFQLNWITPLCCTPSYSLILVCTSLYFFVLLQFSLYYSVSSYNSSARTSRKTSSSVVKHACLLVRRLAMNILLLLTAYLLEFVYRADICVKIFWICVTPFLWYEKLTLLEIL